MTALTMIMTMPVITATMTRAMARIRSWLEFRLDWW